MDDDEDLPTPEEPGWQRGWALRRLGLSDEQYETMVFAAWATKRGQAWPVNDQAKPSHAESAARSRMLRALHRRRLIVRLS